MSSGKQGPGGSSDTEEEELQDEDIEEDSVQILDDPNFSLDELLHHFFGSNGDGLLALESKSFDDLDNDQNQADEPSAAPEQMIIPRKEAALPRAVAPNDEGEYAAGPAEGGDMTESLLNEIVVNLRGNDKGKTLPESDEALRRMVHQWWQNRSAIVPRNHKDIGKASPAKQTGLSLRSSRKGTGQARGPYKMDKKDSWTTTSFGGKSGTALRNEAESKRQKQISLPKFQQQYIAVSNPDPLSESKTKTQRGTGSISEDSHPPFQGRTLYVTVEDGKSLTFLKNMVEAQRQKPLRNHRDILVSRGDPLNRTEMAANPSSQKRMRSKKLDFDDQDAHGGEYGSPPDDGEDYVTREAKRLKKGDDDDNGDGGANGGHGSDSVIAQTAAV